MFHLVFNADEIKLLRMALRLYETTMNLDEMLSETGINDLSTLAHGKIPSRESVVRLARKLGVYDEVDPFFETAAETLRVCRLIMGENFDKDRKLSEDEMIAELKAWGG